MDGLDLNNLEPSSSVAILFDTKLRGIEAIALKYFVINRIARYGVTKSRFGKGQLQILLRYLKM